MRLLGKFRSSAVGSAVPELTFSNVLTPGRIPEFCIPPRLPAPCALESPPPAAALPRRCAAEQDLWPRAADEGAGPTDWDPRSQAALSLPHLPRARTAYGFCALLESPHTRRKESLFHGDPGAAALLRPRTHTYGGGGGGGGGRDGPVVPVRPDPAVIPAALGCPSPPRDALSPRFCGCRLLRAPDGLLSRALRARRSRGLARARSVSSGDEDEERGAGPESPTRAPSERPQPLPGPRPERLEAEGTVALGRAGGVLRLAAEYCPASGRLRIRLLRVEGLAGGASEPRAVGCRISLVLQPPRTTRKQRSSVLRPSRKAALDQDFCFDGLTEDEVRRLAVRVKAEDKGRGLERGRLLGQGELPLGALLLV
ncbi:PREDICTED: C2 calcium-dependent domain-containing protein 4B [Propithecus coquereli]|uniref:C2 calcium-dependent domain-containing protein 4B n=1 Tax=Propithecus coquereli TaxID=379532 RepID=UPI00063F3AAD|nr:PREDICTED: C2 calcium-dependent domain-containing protein 4B [Propithecus coquereli]